MKRFLNQFFLKVTNIVELYDGFYMVEMLNLPEDTYTYYLYKKGFSLKLAFRASQHSRYKEKI